MELTLEQQQAARACGFSFFPATEAQVQRFTMQKRVFWFGSQPFMVTRDGAFWETHGTLMQVVNELAQRELEPVIAEAERSRRPEKVSVRDTEPTPLVQEAELTDLEVTPPEETIRSPARVSRRQTGARVTSRRDGESATLEFAEAAVANYEAASTSDAAESAPEVQADAAPENQGAVRRSRIRQPKEPRWATAGKERRGRLK